MRIIQIRFFLVLFMLQSLMLLQAQTINQVVEDARKKLSLIRDYRAEGSMKTSVSFLKIPEEQVQFLYKSPDVLKIKTKTGVSFVPKGAVSMNVHALLANKNYMVIDAGADKINGTAVRVAKLIPIDEKDDMVLSTLYIDPINHIVLRARSTTKSSGTYELEMSFAKYKSWGLPDKIVFTFDTKDYKLPKGITFDFDDGSAKQSSKKTENTKGTAELRFVSYIINKGINDKLLK